MSNHRILWIDHAIATRHPKLCIYGDKCRNFIVVYKCECSICGMFYIGNTQNHIKKRMNGQFAETRNQVNKGLISDSFATHFTSHFDNKKKNEQISSKDIREITRVIVLWQGNPIPSMKAFDKINCNLCMMVRLKILKATREDRLKGYKKLIKSSNDFYGACRHRTKFHRYRTFKKSISTDEGAKSPERSKQYPEEETQDSDQSLVQDMHNSPLRCVPVPADFSNGHIVMDL